MTKYDIKLEESHYLEYLFFPYLLNINLEAEEYAFYKDDLSDYYKDIRAIKELLEPYKKDFQKNLLTTMGFESYSEKLFNYLCEKGVHFSGLESVFEAFENLSDEELYTNFYQIISGDNDVVNKDNYLTYLDQRSDDDGAKWCWTLAHHDLRNHLNQMIAFYRQICPLYTPFYDKYKDIREQFAKDFDLDEFIDDLDQDFFLGLKEVFDKLVASGKTFSIRVMAPIFPDCKLSYDDEKPEKPVYFYIYPFYKKWLKKAMKVDETNMVTVLKVLSDENRYKVLKELVFSQQKSKDIAKKLGLTPANVSFHTQKLINEQIIGLNLNDDLGLKYQLNRSLLKDIIRFLTKDLGLDDDI